MSNPLNRLGEIRTQNEALFGNMFGSKKTEPESVFQNLGGYKATLGSNHITHFKGIRPETLESYDWKSGKLSWLLKGKFKGELVFDESKEELISFYGTWADGDFMQGDFKGGVQAQFLGGRFYGDNYYAAYDTWKAAPENFMTGLVHDGENGILGLPNLTRAVFNKSTPIKDFHLIQVPAGHSIAIETYEGNKYVITVNKRLDKKTAFFSYTVTDVNIGKSNRVNFEWNQLRSKYREPGYGVIDLMSVRSLPLFEIESESVFKNVEINTASSQQLAPEGDKDTFLPWSFLAGVGGNTIAKALRGAKGIYISMAPDEVGTYNQVIRAIKKGDLARDVQTIRKGIASGAISGYAGFPLFRDIFGDRKGIPLARTKKKGSKYYDAMDRVHDFLDVIVNNMSKKGKMHGKAGISVPYTRAQELMRKKLAEFMQIENFRTIKGDSEGGGVDEPEEPGKFKLNIPKPTNEAVREEIRKIISDNF